MSVDSAGRRRRPWIALGATILLAGVGTGLWWIVIGRVASVRTAGRTAYERGDYRAALRDAKWILKERPRDREALRLSARSSARLGRHKIARDLYRKLAREYLKADDHFLLGLGLLAENHRRAGQAELERAHKQDPNHAETISELVQLAAGSQRLAEATDLAETLARMPGWEPRGLVMLGLLRAGQSDPAGAAEALSRALSVDPSLGRGLPPSEARKHLARALLALGRPAEARKVLGTVLQAGPDREASWLLSRAALGCGDAPGATDALRRAGEYGKDRPQEPEPAPFVGAARCVPCHRDIHRLASASRHAKTYRPGGELEDLALPAAAVADPGNPKVSSTLKRTAAGLRLEVHAGDEIRRALVSFVVGSGDRGLTPVGRDERGQLRELRMSYYGDIAGWDVTTGHSRHPKDADLFVGRPLSRDAERVCLGCHTTDFRAARDRVGPAAADRGIGCERCHGPGGNHLAAVGARFTDLAIGRPRLASPEQVIMLCGQCHSPAGRRVEPTDKDAIRFQSDTLTWSRCYIETGRGLDCVTCHSPHHDADTSPAHYEAKCLACHAALAPPEPARGSARASRHVAALPQRSRRVPCPVNPASHCLECHMPTVRGPMPHTVFTDHDIRIHRGEKTAE